MNQRIGHRVLTAAIVAASVCSAALAAGQAGGGAATVNGARIIPADKEPQNWLAHGRTYSEQERGP